MIFFFQFLLIEVCSQLQNLKRESNATIEVEIKAVRTSAGSIGYVYFITYKPQMNPSISSPCNTSNLCLMSNSSVLHTSKGLWISYLTKLDCERIVLSPTYHWTWIAWVIISQSLMLFLSSESLIVTLIWFNDHKWVHLYFLVTQNG